MRCACNAYAKARRSEVKPSSWHVKDTDNGSIRERDFANLPRGGNAPFVSRLRDERDRRASASRCPRWPEAGAPARAVRDARVEQRLEPRVQEVGAYRRRRHR